MSPIALVAARTPATAPAMIRNAHITRSIFLQCLEAGVEYAKTHCIRPGSKPTKSRVTESLEHALKSEKSGDKPFEQALVEWNNGSGSWMLSTFILNVMPGHEEPGIKLAMLHKAVLKAREALATRWHNEPPKVDGMIFVLEILHRCLEFTKNNVVEDLEKAVRIMDELRMVDHGALTVQLLFTGFAQKLKTFGAIV